MAAEAAQPALLTVDTVGDYVAGKLRSLPEVLLKGSTLNAREVHGGNLNFSFEVSDGVGGSVFVKQAPDFIKVLGKDAKLHRERLQLEVNVFEKISVVLGERASEFLPKLFVFDPDGMVFISEFLGSYCLLQESLFAGVAREDVASKLGEFMGLLHAGTHSTKVTPAEAEQLTSEYANSILRNVQLEYVFSKCFREDDRAKHLRDDPDFMKVLEGLKDLYRGQNKGNLALLHGDLHAGSVMADQQTGNAKVIDPEFCIYGPPGLDVGSLISTYALAYCFHAATGSESRGGLKTAIEQVWSSYAKTMADRGITAELLESISCEAAGFAGCEIARTALGMAYERSLKLSDVAAKAEAERQALGVGAACIAGRHQGVGVLTSALDKFGSY